MTQLEGLARELEREAMTTRKMLSALPDAKLDWQPHEKSMAMGRLATHIAELPTWIGMVLNTHELDFANNSYVPRSIDSTAALLTFFEDCLADGRKALAAGDEGSLGETWTMRSGETIHSRDSRLEVLRMSMSQIIHHRAQLGVYLRLLNIPVPASYGPSADDESF